MSLAIACMSGSFKGVFVHGVLTEFEACGFRAAAYASASSSTLTAGYAAIGEVRTIGVDFWTRSLDAAEIPGTTMSDLVLANLRALTPRLKEALFQAGASRFLIAASRVATEEAASVTQGPNARRLGRRLLLDAARHDAAWPAAHLELCLFDSAAEDSALTPANFDEVAYATTRMMHAWPIPASIQGVPYIDASYTCLCPALEMAARGYDEVIAIATEPGPVPRSMFSAESIPAESNGARIRIVQPDTDLRELGVDFTTATRDGLERAFELGRARAQPFLADR